MRTHVTNFLSNFNDESISLLLAINSQDLKHIFHQFINKWRYYTRVFEIFP